MKLQKFNTISRSERLSMYNATYDNPLSGFLGGESRGGKYVRTLEENWCETFGCTHAIAVNSATSGLLAACQALDVYAEYVAVSPYTMSATVAAPVFLGADPYFIDIEPKHYCMSVAELSKLLDGPGAYPPKVVIVTNLFGHPAQLKTITKLIHAKGGYLIEDNAQAPFAKEDGSYAGTIGDIGVFSLNVHKHIQSGEGGVVVTDNDDFARAIRLFINHGEMAGGPVGLNLRMTEVTAAIACAQLSRGPQIVQSRIDLAEALIEGLKDNPMVTIHPPREGCRHVYYALPMELSGDRTAIIRMLDKLGVPLAPGYVPPLYWMPAFREFAPQGGCPVTEKLHKETLAYFEVCSWDPTNEQIRDIINAFDHVALETLTNAD